MAKAISDEAIAKATGKPWEHWTKFFNGIGAQNLSHKEIAVKAYEAGIPAWWAQMVTVRYEQEIGRRVAGQDCDGEFAVSVNKTVNGNMDDVLSKWVDLATDKQDFSDVAVSRPGKITVTEKWRYWRCGLADGSVVNINIYQKAPGKAALSIQHEKLESTEQAEHWRSYWKDFVANLA